MPRRSQTVAVPQFKMSLDGQEVTGFEYRELLGKGGYGRVYAAVCSTCEDPHITDVCCKVVEPPARLRALRGPFRAGNVLAIRCCEEDADSGVPSLLETQGLLERKDDHMYWLCKVRVAHINTMTRAF